MVLPAQNAATRGSQSGPLAGLRKSAEITPGAIGGGATLDVDFAFAGAQVGDIASVSFDTALASGVIFGGASIAAPGHVILHFAANGTDRTQGAITANVSLQKKL